MTGSIGAGIARQGWRQGSVIREEDLPRFSEQIRPWVEEDRDGLVAIVVSQSCDMTHPSLADEPVVEIQFGRLENVACGEASHRGNLTYGKNPRVLCIPVQHVTAPVWMECRAYDRGVLARQALLELAPDDKRFLLREDLRILLRWLAQRYERAAFPDQFNAMLESFEKKRKRLHARLAPNISGLFVELSPERDLQPGEQYRVNLLALVPEQRAHALENVLQLVRELGSLFSQAGMDVESAAKLESGISYAVVRRFHPFPLDHLSLREDPAGPMPLG